MNSATVDTSTRRVDAAGPARPNRSRNRIARKLTRGVEHVRKRGTLIAGMIFDPALSRSYWPEERRKSRPRVLFDLIWGLVRYQEWNGYYYVYGMDRKNGPRARDFLPQRTFRRLRNRTNLSNARGRYNYVCVLRDKFLFAQLLTSLGVPTPRPLALLDQNTITWLDHGTPLPLRSLQEPGRELDGFCKEVDGSQGDGVFPLSLRNGKILLDGVEISVEELRRKLTRRFLLQERIEQHAGMSSLNPTSVNTIRLITFCKNGQATIFCGALRVGASGKSVDNWASGGLIVAVDVTTGQLSGDGFFKPGYGGRVPAHPDTHTRFSGFEIPHFHEAARMVTRVHGYLPHIHSIGWDIAIATTGPVIIEGNDDWEGGIPMVLVKDFKQRFLQMF